MLDVHHYHTNLQGRPLLEFQVEEGEDGGKWLTCILFPQQGPQTPYDGEDQT